MRKVIFIGFVGVLALFFASCRKEGAKQEKGKVGISVLTMTNPFFKEIAEVLKVELAIHGYDSIIVDPDKDVAKQENQVDDFLAQKVSAIVLCPCRSMEVGAAIRKANKAGVPVFTADIACIDPEAKVVTHVATDNYAGGKQAGEAMIEALGAGGGKVLVLDFQQVESCQLRIKGFDEVIKAHNDKPNVGSIKVVDRLDCGGDKEKGFKATQDALQSHADLAGIFAINDPAALGARAAMEAAKRIDRIKIIGFDGQPEGKKAILEGKIYADPIQHPDKIARETAKAMTDFFAGKQPPPTILIPTNLYRQVDALAESKK